MAGRTVQNPFPKREERAFIGAVIAYAKGWRLQWYDQLPAGINLPGWELQSPLPQPNGVYITLDKVGTRNDLAAMGWGITNGTIPDFAQDVWLIFEHLLNDDLPYKIDGTGDKPVVTIGEVTVTAESYNRYDQAAAIAEAWYSHYLQSTEG